MLVVEVAEEFDRKNPGGPPQPSHDSPGLGSAFSRLAEFGWIGWRYAIEKNYSIAYDNRMHPFQRSQVRTLCQRLDAIPERLIAIFGPRQTGKTTIVHQALAQIELTSRYLAIDEPDHSVRIPTPGLGATDIKVPRVSDTDWLVRHWQAARLEAERSGQGSVLALDEIQKLADWSSTVKGLWDADRARACPLRVVILGSAPLLMQSGLNESLAGRFLPLSVTHWTYEEMSQAFGFSLDEYCYFGGYPGAAPLKAYQDLWRDYILEAIVAPAIDRDLLAMTRVDKPALLRRLFEVGCSYSGQILSFNKIMGHLQDAGNTTTLARYLDLLSRVGLLAGLPNYSGARYRRRASSPKLQVLNSALLTAWSGYTFDEARNDRSFWGRIVESAVGAHLLNTATSGIRVYYWRYRNSEVDFVLERGPRIVAIEVKSGAKTRALSGMNEFRRRYEPHDSLVVGADGIPLDQFLSEPAPRWLED